MKCARAFEEHDTKTRHHGGVERPIALNYETSFVEADTAATILFKDYQIVVTTTTPC